MLYEYSQYMSYYLLTELSIKILCEWCKYSHVTSAVVERAFMTRESSNKRSRKDTENTGVLRMFADSGCTTHMAPSVEVNSTSLAGYVRSSTHIDTAGTESLYSEGYGAFGPLAKLLSVDGLSDALFSIYATCQKGNTAVFTRDSVRIFSDAQVTTEGAPILQGGVEDKMYVFNISEEDAMKERAFVADVKVENRCKLWHQRLLHMSNRTLQVMQTKSIVTGMDRIPKLHTKQHKQCLCEACCVGKMHMKGQRKKPKVVPTGHDYKPGQLVFMDLFQSNVQSNGKNLYCLLIVDAKSKRLWKYFMPCKHYTIDRIIEWVEDVKSEGSIDLKSWTTMRSDNGGEFMSDEVKSYLRSQGIRKTTSAPYMHVNAVERQIQTVKDAVRTIINAARTELSHAAKVISGGKHANPFSFWCDAVSTVVYTLNRMPMHRGALITRLQAWDNTKPDISHLRTFGCTVYAKIYDELNDSTWSDRAYQGIFLGYDESCPNTYRVYNLETKRIVNTSNLIFNENLRGKEVRLTMSDEDSTTIPNVTLDEIFGALADSNLKITKEQKREVEKYLNKKYGIDAEWSADSFGLVRKGVIPGSVGNPIMHEVSVDEDRILTRAGRRLMRESMTRNQESARVCRALSATERREPNTIKQAKQSEDWKHWKEAIIKEVTSLVDTRTLVPMLTPTGVKPIGLKWVFKIKEAMDGSIERYKVRCTALGNLQKYGVDFDETFSPVVRMKTLRSLMAISAVRGYHLHGMDIETAFLYGDLDPSDPIVYVKVPEMFPLPPELEPYRGSERICCKVGKSIYGLKQSPRAFNKTFDKYMCKHLGFTRSKNDACLYEKEEFGETIFVAVFVDDLVMAGSSEAVIERFKQELSRKFRMKDLGVLTRILGMEVNYFDDHTLSLTQKKYINETLVRFHMSECREASTPMEPGMVLSKQMSPKTQAERLEAAKFPYRELVGTLLYLSTHTRIDIAYTVSQLSRFMDSHGSGHHKAALHCLRYLKGTVDKGVTYGTDKSEQLIGFSDSDWAKCIDTGRSVTGYVFYLGGGPITWTSKTQPTVAQSSTEAELMAATFTSKEAVHLRQLCYDLKIDCDDPTIICEDNQGAIALSLNPVFHERTKHIRVKYFYVRECVQEGEVKLHYVRTDKQLADVLTKATSKGIFVDMVDTLMGNTGLEYWFSDSTEHGEIEFYDDESDGNDSD